MCGSEITKETYFNELISPTPYFYTKSVASRSEVNPKEVHVTIAGSNKSKRRPSLYKKHGSIKINGKTMPIYIGSRCKNCIKSKNLYIELN